MQIESFVLINHQNEILYSCNSLSNPNEWNQYVDRLVKLIPDMKQNPQGFLPFNDFAIGVQTIGEFRIIVTARNSSDIFVETVMKQALDQFQKIIQFLCGDVFTQEVLMERDRYIQFQLLMQEEVSASGYMRFIERDEFDEIVDF